MTCDVLNAVWVKVLLAFPTVLFEVNLEHTILQLGQHIQIIDSGHQCDEFPSGNSRSDTK